MAQTKIKASQFSGVIGNGVNGYVLQSSGDGDMEWVASITPPTVASLSYPGSATAADPAGGQTVTITGTGFASGATVTVGGTAAPAVSFVSATTLTITTPAKAAGDYDVVVTNTDTGSATFINGISYNGIPAWTTAAGSLGAFASAETISTITLAATEPDGGTITFNITNGALPTGLSLTGANIDGTTSLETAETLYTFTVTATDNENQTTPRVFTITVEKEFKSYENFTINTYTGNGSTQNIEGKIGTAAVFNGSSSEIVVPTVSNIKSYSFWIKAVDIGSNYGKRIFGLDSSSYTDCVTYTGNTSSKVGVVDGAGNTFYSDTVSDNNWHHIAITTDGNTLKIYTDGAVSSTNSTTYFTSSFTHIGSNNTNRQFKGNLDQIRIFDKELSSSEVTTLYGESNTSTTKSTTDIFDDGSGVALYEFEDGAKDTGGVTGKFGSAAIFNGSTSQITFDNLPTSSTMSVSFWMKTDSAMSGYQMILELDNGYAINRPSAASSGKIYAQYANSNSSHKSNSDTLPVGTYFHVVGVFTSSSATLYINNVNQTGGTIDDYLTADQNTIGSRRSNGFFTGQIDDVRIYSDALTAAEVGYIYNNTTASIPTDNLEAYYKLDGDANDEEDNYNGTATNVSYAYDGTPTDVGFVGTSFQPDLVWIKSRNAALNHVLNDSIRGAGKILYPNLTYVGDAGGDYWLSSFDSNGFTVNVTGGNGTNASNTNYVAWMWKAGGTAVSNTDGTITSSVSANQDAGFSIVQYTGNQTATTVGHGLSQAPEMIIAKSTTVAQNWVVYHKDAGSNYWLQLNGSVARIDEPIWNDTTPTDSVFSMNGNVVINKSGSTNIAYCFHSVTGYQKVGSYSMSSGAAVTVDVGFQPRFVLLKEASRSAGWIILDNQRNLSGNYKARLFPNESGAESSGQQIQFIGNTFKINWGSTGNNHSGGTGIYLAIK